MRPQLTQILVLARATPCVTRSESPNILALVSVWVQKEYTGCHVCHLPPSRALSRTARDLGHAVARPCSVDRLPLPPLGEHPPQGDHLHRGCAAGRLRAGAPCWRTGPWGTRGWLEDRGHAVSADWELRLGAGLRTGRRPGWLKGEGEGGEHWAWSPEPQPPPQVHSGARCTPRSRPASGPKQVPAGWTLSLSSPGGWAACEIRSPLCWKSNTWGSGTIPNTP